MNARLVKRILIYGSIVVFIGVLVAISIPAYQDYTPRAQVSEGLNLSEEARLAVESYYRAHGSPPSNNKAADLSSGDNRIAGVYVESVEIVFGRVDIRYGNNSDRVLQSEVLSITPYYVGDQIIWRCGNARLQGDDTLESLDPVNGAYQPGSLGRYPKYLPSGCR